MMPSRTNRFSALFALALIVGTLGVYASVLDHEFVYFDDTTYVIENREVHRGLSPSTVAWAFTTDRMGTWHPLTWLSHAADWSVYGADAGGHHLSSLILHVLNAWLLFAVLRRLTGSAWTSAFVAMAFAVHPLNVASVAWVASRKGLLSTTFLLLTIAAYVRYTTRPGPLRYLAVLVAFGLALLSKPMAVTLPFLLLLLDVWPLGRLGWTGRSARGSRPWFEKVPLFGMAAAVGAVALAVGRVGDPVPLGERLLAVPVAYVTYLSRVLWPAGLATPYPPAGSPGLPAALGATVLLVGITLALLRDRERRPYLAVGWLWLLVTLAPVVGVVQIGAHPMADRWMYVPMIGILIAVAWGVSSVWPRAEAARAGLVAASVLVVVVLGVAAHAQVRHWRDTEALFRRALDVTENNRAAHYNLAWYLAKQGRADEAIAHYRRAIEISPSYFAAHHNLALVLFDEGRTDEARAATCAAIAVIEDREEPFRAGLVERLDGAACP